MSTFEKSIVGLRARFTPSDRSANASSVRPWCTPRTWNMSDSFCIAPRVPEKSGSNTNV